MSFARNFGVWEILADLVNFLWMTFFISGARANTVNVIIQANNRPKSTQTNRVCVVVVIVSTCIREVLFSKIFLAMFDSKCMSRAYSVPYNRRRIKETISSLIPIDE